VGASVIVDGSVRPVGSVLRVQVQLVDAATGLVRSSETFDRSTEALLALQDEIAQRIAGVVVAPSAAAAAPRDFAVYELYLRGRYFWKRRPGPVVWRALECFQQAVARDPGFAAAWAGMADVYSTLGSWEAGVLPHGEAQALARAYAGRALELDPASAEAQTTLAYTTLHYDADLPAAKAAFQRALALGPRYAAAHHWYAHALVAEGRLDAALAEGQLALADDPGSLLLNVHFSWHWHFARRPELGREQAERVIAMDPHFHWGHYFDGWAAEALGEAARAVDAMERAVRMTDGDPVMVAGAGRARAVAGDHARARELMAALAARPGGADLFAYEIALIHLAMAELDAAFASLARARAARSGWLVYLAMDPRWDPVRGDPRLAP
jgi:tetratricopeptide (TPR) repeat protein